jgi:hypothetical protein
MVLAAGAGAQARGGIERIGEKTWHGGFSRAGEAVPRGNGRARACGGEAGPIPIIPPGYFTRLPAPRPALPWKRAAI